MKKLLVLMVIALLVSGFAMSTQEYPPGVGVLTDSRSCISCHADNGPWNKDDRTIIDVLDQETKASLRQPDGSFAMEVMRGHRRTVLTVIGRPKSDSLAVPNRHGWTYIDPLRIGTGSISKFAPGWAVDLQMSCRLVGDQLPGFEDANITVLPMTVMPLDDARDAEVELQLMLTAGDSGKGAAMQHMLGSYFVRTLKLKVTR
ncbi:MAG TPA: hypothetical protein PKE21_14445 [Flavobacteriales bacterium]|nr:hypothetical protein [Flavobacteriales bacterium]HMR28679.1 hypothetical protein [Flavobacteriales bacterium]